QDFEWLDGDGRSVRHTHYPPPSNLGMTVFMLGAAAALNALGPQHPSSSSTLSFNANYGDVAKRFMHDFHASSRSDSVLFVLAELNETGMAGPALIAIDRRSGEVRRRIPVSKRPRYLVDPLRDRIFVVEGKTVRCHLL